MALQRSIQRSWELFAARARQGLAPTYSSESLRMHAALMQEHEAEVLRKTAGSDLAQLDSLEALIKATQHTPELEGLNGHASELWNHFFAFSSLCVHKDQGRPSPYIQRLIDSHFLDESRFHLVWSETAGAIVGHGWTWLLSRGGDLEISSTFNRQTVATNIDTTPLVALDMCEHAFFPDYRHNKKSYARAIWNNVDWKLFEERYRQSLLAYK